MKKSVYLWVGVLMSFLFIFVNGSVLAEPISGTSAQITNLVILGIAENEWDYWEFTSYAEAGNETGDEYEDVDVENDSPFTSAEVDLGNVRATSSTEEIADKGVLSSFSEGPASMGVTASGHSYSTISGSFTVDSDTTVTISADAIIELWLDANPGAAEADVWAAIGIGSSVNWENSTVWHSDQIGDEYSLTDSPYNKEITEGLSASFAFSSGSKGYVLAIVETRASCVITTCPGDFDNDYDVDGNNLAELAANPAFLNLSTFAAHFGRTDCLYIK